MIAHRLACRIARKQVRKLFGERSVAQLGRKAGNTALEQRAFRTWINNGRAKLAQHRNLAINYVDGLHVSHREQLLVHVFTQHTDAHAIQSLISSEAGVGFGWHTTDAEHRVFVLGIVPGDDIENARGILHRATDRSNSCVHTRLDHTDATYQLHGCRNTHGIVGLGRTTNG